MVSLKILRTWLTESSNVPEEIDIEVFLFCADLGACPPIIDGPLYSAFHGFIQMGYGLAVGSHQAVVEGITIMDQQYSPLYGNDMNNPKVRPFLSEYHFNFSFFIFI